MDINRLKKLMEQKDGEILHLNTTLNMREETIKDIEAELDLKAGENNRLRAQVGDLEEAMQDLYYSRKGQGTLKIELDSLKADNERLIALLKDTCEYAEMESDEIVKAAAKMSLDGKGTKAIDDTLRANLSARGIKDPKQKTAADRLNNDWIPTESVRAINKIKEKFKGQMTDSCISRILYELNTIWRNIMRKETEAIRKRL